MSDEKWSLADRKGIADAIKRLPEEDLLYLNRVIVERLQLLSQARSTVFMSRFNTGDRVGFETSTGEGKQGVIPRLNRKTASVLTDDGHHWKVSPLYLYPLTDVPERK